MSQESPTAGVDKGSETSGRDASYASSWIADLPEGESRGPPLAGTDATGEAAVRRTQGERGLVLAYFRATNRISAQK